MNPIILEPSRRDRLGPRATVSRVPVPSLDAGRVDRCSEAGIAHWFALVISIIGVGLLTLSVTTCSSSRDKIDRFAKAEGEVVGFDSEYDSEEGYDIHYPIVAFSVKDVVHEFRASVGTGPEPAYESGEKVEVLYDPANPKEADLDSFAVLWMPVIILAILGVAATAWGAGLWWLWIGEADQRRAAKARRESEPAGPEKTPHRLSWPALVAAFAIGLGGGCAAAFFLPYLPSIFWVGASIVLLIIASIALLFDNGARHDPEPGDPSLAGVSRTKVIWVILIAQLPCFGVRAMIGGPEIRAAQAYCESVASTLIQESSAQTELTEEGPAHHPEDRALPEFLQREGIRYGQKNGRFVVVFTRTLMGMTETYTLDVRRGQWSHEEFQ